MSASGPLLDSRGLWAKREARCLSILVEALERLRKIADLPKSEVDLNRCLYFCLLEASRELYPEEEVAPQVECNNQPDPDDEARTKRELKRPDFQWAYLDRYEERAHHSSKQFVVECKRLGKAIRSDWVLNANYVQHGIMRFNLLEWAYAKRFSTGAMVGYWQNMEPHDVLSEVNEEGSRNALPPLVLDGLWSPGGVSRFAHVLDRPFEVTPFTLQHLWVDLRSGKGK